MFQVVDAATGRLQKILKSEVSPFECHTPVWLRDSDSLVFCSNKDLRLWRVSKDVEEMLVPAVTDLRKVSGKLVPVPVLSSDGEHVAAMLQDGRHQIWKIEQSRAIPVVLFDAQPATPYRIRFSGGGAALMSASASEIKVWDVHTLLSAHNPRSMPTPFLWKTALCHELWNAVVSYDGSLVLWTCVRGCVELLGRRERIARTIWRMPGTDGGKQIDTVTASLR